MLTLTRKVGQTIVVRDHETKEKIGEIVIKEIRRNQVRIGIVAKREDWDLARQEVDMAEYPDDYPPATVSARISKLVRERDAILSLADDGPRGAVYDHLCELAKKKTAEIEQLRTAAAS